MLAVYSSRNMIKSTERNHLLGEIVPSGTEIKKANEKVNVTEDNISKRKHSHSIAPALKNFGRE